jgi:tetratricopeptide (TPR) repeat protein
MRVLLQKLLLILLLPVASLSAQDSTFVRTLIDSGMALGYTRNESLPLFEKAATIAGKENYTELQAFALKNVGVVYYYEGEYYPSLDYWNKSNKLYEKLGKDIKVANNLNNIGNVHLRLMQFAEALEAYRRCLGLASKYDDQKVMAAAYGNMGNVYEKTGDFRKALEMHRKSFSLDSMMGNLAGMGKTLTNIGAVHEHLNRGDLAYEAYLKALEICRQNNDSIGISAAYSNMGNIFQHSGEFETAMKYHRLSLEIDQKKHNTYGIAISLNNIAGIYQKTARTEDAIKYFEQALEVATEHNFNDILLSCYNNLHELYFAKGEWKMALDFLRKYQWLQQDVYGQEKYMEVARQEMMYEYEMKVIRDSLQQAERDKRQKLEDENRALELAREHEQKQYALVAAVVFLFVSLLMFRLVLLLRRSAKRRKEQMMLIESQRKDLEAKNNRITEGMEYGGIIQQQFLPDAESFKDLPLKWEAWLSARDVVGGDFYFMKKTGEMLWIAVADCTGHGVPGAMLAVLGNQIISRCVSETVTPAQVLDKAHRSFRKAIGTKTRADVQDGMDIALIRINLANRSLLFAGARNNAWLVRDNAIITMEATRRSVGLELGEEPVNFNDLAFDWLPGDQIWLCTDGITDQFVHTEKGLRKYGSAGLKRDILRLQSEDSVLKTMDAFKSRFLKDLGDEERLDDLCIMYLKSNINN